MQDVNDKIDASNVDENNNNNSNFDISNLGDYIGTGIIFDNANNNGIKCRNSIQGKHLITDDRGYVCTRNIVDINGCCSINSSSSSSIITSSLIKILSSSMFILQSKQYSCESCHLSLGCCAIYEYCISCCMSPTNRQLLNRELLLLQQKSTKTNKQQSSTIIFRIFIDSITDYFELCLTKCRTSSASVQHENTYRNPVEKYCYSSSLSSSS